MFFISGLASIAACAGPVPGSIVIDNAASPPINAGWYFVSGILFACAGIFVFLANNREGIPNSPVSNGFSGSFSGEFNTTSPSIPASMLVIIAHFLFLSFIIVINNTLINKNGIAGFIVL